jgi:hypothetical protein
MQTTASPSGRVSLFGYLANYVGVYLVLSTVLAVTIAVLQIKGGAMGVIAMMVSVMPAMTKFIKVHQRGMSKSERLRFAGWATALVFAASAAAWCLFVTICGNAQQIGYYLGMFMTEIGRSPVLLPTVLLFGGMMQFGVLYFATGLFGRQALKAASLAAGGK